MLYYPLQLLGFGITVSMAILSATGDIQRFPDVKHLIGCVGLGASIHDSGEIHFSGHITKKGRKDLRRVLVETARVAVSSHPFWREECQLLARRMPTTRLSSLLPENCRG